MQPLADRESGDESAAFAAFTQNLAQTPRSAVGATSAKSSAKRRSWAWPTLIGSALVIGACTVMAGAILWALRIPNRSLYDVAETGTYKDMPSLLVPLVWGAGYLGAVGGSAVFAGIAVHLATGSPDQQFLFQPPAIGGAMGAALCGAVIGAAWVSAWMLAPRSGDTIYER